MRQNFSGIIWGLALIALGVFMLLDSLGYWEFDLGYFLNRWWPLVLIFIGLGILLDSSSKKRES